MCAKVAEPAFPPGGDAGGLHTALQTFEVERNRLFRIAHRVTGDIGGAEDVVQEAWMRWQRADRSTINNPAAFLTTVTTNLAINVIQSARHRHELPSEETAERVMFRGEEPAEVVERQDDIANAMGFLLARLSGSEFAAYVLRKGFDYPYSDIAEIMSTSAVNARQLVRRAQLRLDGDGSTRFTTSCQTLLATSFRAGCRGEMTTLEQALLTHVRGRCGGHPGCRPSGPSPASMAAMAA